MNGIIIEKATHQQAALIADISRLCFYDTFAKYNTEGDMNKFMTEQFTREMLMREVGAANNIFLLAYVHNEVAGYAKLSHASHELLMSSMPSAEAIEIARIYALQNYIGTGIGSTLMQECISLGRQHHKQTIWLGVWEKNQKAIDFYKRWGFEKFGEHEFILGNDIQNDWLMKKDL